MLDYRYAYFIGSIISLLVWAIFFILRKDLRKEMLILSFVTMFLGPTNIIYYETYWKPGFLFEFYNFGVESLIVCFAYGGVCAVAYEFFFRKTGRRLKGVSLQISKIQFMVSVLLGVCFMICLEIFTPLNPIYTTSLGLFVVSLAFIFFRRDLLVPSLASGVITMIISTSVYWLLLIFFPEFFDRFWIEDTISNIRILFVPIEEYFFHFALGMCLGVMYEVGTAEIDR